MRISVPSRLILSALLVALVAPAAAWPQEETPKAKIQKKQQAPQTATAQTQTAPTGPQTKGKATQTAPGKAGLRAIQGMVDGVFPDRRIIMIRTNINEIQVYVTPQSVLSRDSQPVDIKQLRRGDRVDYCHYNAKNVVQKMGVTSAEKARITPPLPPPEP